MRGFSVNSSMRSQAALVIETREEPSLSQQQQQQQQYEQIHQLQQQQHRQRQKSHRQRKKHQKQTSPQLLKHKKHGHSPQQRMQELQLQQELQQRLQQQRQRQQDREVFSVPMPLATFWHWGSLSSTNDDNGEARWGQSTWL